jgi:hypothetical protein
MVSSLLPLSIHASAASEFGQSVRRLYATTNVFQERQSSRLFGQWRQMRVRRDGKTINQAAGEGISSADERIRTDTLDRRASLL